MSRSVAGEARGGFSVQRGLGGRESRQESRSDLWPREAGVADRLGGPADRRFVPVIGHRPLQLSRSRPYLFNHPGWSLS